MKANELRQSILQAAVHGKLVPQNPQDEPASELLKRIQQEKTQLVKEGKLKKKTLPPVADDEFPYDLPEGWAWCRLGEIILDIFTGPFGSMLHKSDYVENGIPLVNPMNMVDQKIVPSKKMLVSQETRKRLSSYVLSTGDIVVARRGELGRCALVSEKENGWICGTGSFFLRLTSLFDTSYFLLLFRSYQTRQQLAQNSVGATMNNLNHNILKQIHMGVPPLSEQHRIVDKVEKLMFLCDALEAEERKLDALEAHFTKYLPKAIMQAAVQGKLVPQNTHDEPASELLKRIQQKKAQLVKEGKLKKEKSLPLISEDEIPYDLPEGWEWCRLRDIGQIIGGATPDSHESSYYTKPGQGISWLTPADMTKYTQNNYISHGAKDITQAGYNSCSTMLMPPGSIIFSSRAPIGHIAFSSKEVCTNQGFKSVVPYMTAVTPWIFYALKSKVDDIQSRASGTTFKEVSGKFMESETIPLPPLVEQQRIVTKVEELLALCNEMKASYTEPVEFDEVAEIIPFSTSVASEHTEELEEPLLLAARGDAENLSSEALRAIDDLFAEDEE